MAAHWSYSTTVKAPQPAELALHLSASSPSSSSLDTLLASTTPALNLRVTAHGALLDLQQLAESAVVAEVRDWLDENKSTIAIDHVGLASPTAEDISIALHAFSRSARAATLSLANAVDGADIREREPPRLASLALELDFRSSTSSASRPRKRARLAPLDTSPSSASSPPQQHPPGSITLAAQLLDASGAPLHFALAGLVDVALTRWAKKLVGAFPLCFNARWIERVSGDLAAQHSVAGSLTRILGLRSGDEPHSGGAGEGEDKAVVLMRRLNTHLSTAYPSRFPSSPCPALAASPPPSLIDPALLSPPPSPALAPVPPAIEPADALEAALLVLTTRTAKPDPWVPPPPLSLSLSGEADDEGAGAGGSRIKRGSSGKARKGQGGGGRGSRAKRGRERVLSVGDDDMLLDEDSPSRPDSPPLAFDASPTLPTSLSPPSHTGFALSPAGVDGAEDGGAGNAMDWQLAD
ncbi:hypothetical protein JCM8208_007593 [Rhodotorula glutinis]